MEPTICAAAPRTRQFACGTSGVANAPTSSTLRLRHLHVTCCFWALIEGYLLKVEYVLASPACCVCVNGPGTLLAFGTEDAKVVLMDLRRVPLSHLAFLDTHSSDVRSARFSPSMPNYLLTGSYDSKVAVTYCGGKHILSPNINCSYQ